MRAHRGFIGLIASVCAVKSGSLQISLERYIRMSYEPGFEGQIFQLLFAGGSYNGVLLEPDMVIAQWRLGVF